MPFGAQEAHGGVRFRLWAPAQRKVCVVLGENERRLPMETREGGWHELVTDAARARTSYRFALEDGTFVPDPASRFQPRDVQGPSEVVDPRAYAWSHPDWRGRAWEEAVVYELHVGTFTPAGTYRAAIDKLDHLVDLGVTAIELMPVGDFPGRRGWGYDGVLPFAPDSAYGRPEDLKALVDAAHARNLMVLLDVVYNHFGPVGNYLHAYAPQFFTARHKTPWGDAIDYDGPDSGPVREFMIQNALYWIDEYCLDGLRLDAVHAIVDDSPKHVLEELAERVRQLAVGQRRQVHLVVENEKNQARLLERDAERRPRWFTAQWDDDMHHCLHVAATGETAGYYEDYPDPVRMLGRALAEGFVYQGERSKHQDGGARGEPSSHLPPDAFIAFIQNHDQIGNRAFGERLTHLAEPAAVRAVAAIYLLAPSVPMLFMGEEWATSRPFNYFCDLPELADAIREGRRKEFEKFPQFRHAHVHECIPDPNDRETFTASCLDWQELNAPAHREWLAWYRSALDVRREIVVPLVRDAVRTANFEVIGTRGLRVRWDFEGGSALTLLANLGDDTLRGITEPPGRIVFAAGERADERLKREELGAWSVVWFVERS